MDNSVFESIKNKFSGKQKKFFEKIEKIIDYRVAIVLTSQQGVSGTSRAEIEFVVNLIKGFKPLSVDEFELKPRRLVIVGRIGLYKVKIYPQFPVAQPEYHDEKMRYNWSVDVVTELYACVGGVFECISIVGYEYDGHISHFVESTVKKTYIRDAIIFGEKGFNPIRVYPEQVKNNPEAFGKALLKHFNKEINKFEKLQLNTINISQALPFLDVENLEPLSLLVTCPLCNGRCSLAGTECPVCRGLGSIKKSIAKNINLEEYDEISCPKCNGNLDCVFCKGNGKIRRDFLN